MRYPGFMPDNSSILAVAAAASLLALSAPAQAQWLNYKTPGIPRAADGKPNLSAPAPRMANGKPDLSGLWRTDNSGSAALGKAMDALKPQPWAAALAKKRKEELFRDAPACFACLPVPWSTLALARWSRPPTFC